MDFPENAPAYFIYEVSVDVRKPLFPRGHTHIDALVGTDGSEHRAKDILRGHLVNVVWSRKGRDYLLKEVRSGRATYTARNLSCYTDREGVIDFFEK